MKILVVEDNTDSRKMLETVLLAKDYDVLCAENGQIALDLALRMQPDLVVSDILMPVMDGYTLCKKLRQDQQLHSVLFVFYTATYTDDKDRNLAMELGADKFLLKPLEPHVLLQELETLIENRQAAETREAVKTVESELQIEKKYSQQVFHKLEKKVSELEELRSQLELKVAERTQKLQESVALLTKEVETRKIVQEELYKEKEKAEAAYEFISDFVSTVSHELRTPLTSILGFAQMLHKEIPQLCTPKHDEICDRSLKHIEIITSESQRIIRMINELLDKAKLEAGKVEWHFTEQAIQKLIDHAFSVTYALFKAKHLDCETRIEPDLPLVLCDPEKILQVLINLFSNAAKFTTKGSVVCSATRQDNMLLVSVKDTGPGIPEEEQTAIFDKFKQSYAGRSSQGTGLGLSICKDIIDNHKGRIWVESQPGSGSTFLFSLPFTQ